MLTEPSQIIMITDNGLLLHNPQLMICTILCDSRQTKL